MARTTAAHGRAAGADRCRECNTKAEATVTGPTPRGEVTFRVCLSHTLRYVKNDDVTVTADPEANVALCACKRFIGHGGRAAHNCAASAA